MLKRESTDMFQAATAPEDLAVRVEAVSKSFTQWKRKEEPSGKEKLILKEKAFSGRKKLFCRKEPALEENISCRKEPTLEENISCRKEPALEKSISCRKEPALEENISCRKEPALEENISCRKESALKENISCKKEPALKENISCRKKHTLKENISCKKEPALKENISCRKKHTLKENFSWRKNIFRQEKKTVTALDHVSFQIRHGEFVAYAGPNGAGKSTTMKLLSGILQPTEGTVSVLGMSPERDRIALMKKLGVLFGNRTELWWDHPVIQSFEWKKVVWNIPNAVYRRNLDMVTDLLEIGEIRNTFARELSLGQRMRADLAMMLLHSPELILLDEPTLGLDVVAKRQMIDFLKKINQEEGVTILVTSHDMDDLEEMAQRILMISNGKLAFDGSFNGLRDIAGNLTHFIVTTDGRRPVLEGCRLLSEKCGVFEFEVDLSRLPVKGLLERLSKADGIMDVEIRKAPIELVIAQLYQAWKGA